LSRQQVTNYGPDSRLTVTNLAANGVASVGAAALASTALTVAPTALSGTTQYGAQITPTFTTAATASAYGLQIGFTIPASFTEPWVAGLCILGPTLGSGGAITNAYGIVINNMGAAGVTNATGLWIGAQSGASGNNIGIYNQGSSQLVGPLFSPIYIGNTNQIVRNPVNSASHISVESRNGYAFMCAALNSHVASNTFWDGSQWYCITTANPGSYFGVTAGGVNFNTCPATASTCAFTQRWAVDGSGNMINTGTITANSDIYAGGASATNSMWATAFRYGSGGGSYYTQLTSTNYCYFVNMNILSGGLVAFNANTGINLSFNGSQFALTHNLILNSNYLYFGNTSQCWYWDGSWIRASGGSGIGTSGSYVWMANNQNIGMYWDGTWLQVGNAGNGAYSSVGFTIGWASVSNVFAMETGKSVKIYYDNTVAAARVPYGNGLYSPAFNVSSSRRYKWALAELDEQNCLDLVLDRRFKPYRYTCNFGTDLLPIPDQTRLGFVAEEVFDVLPEAITSDDEGPESMALGQIEPLLVGAVRRLEARVRELEARLAA